MFLVSRNVGFLLRSIARDFQNLESLELFTNLFCEGGGQAKGLVSVRERNAAKSEDDQILLLFRYQSVVDHYCPIRLPLVINVISSC